MATYGTIVTSRGEALIANYLLLGRKLDITEVAVGDGGGDAYQPTPDMTALRRETWRGKVNTVEVDPGSPNVIVIRALIPQDVGGFTIREAGVFDADGTMIGVMNTPQIEKVAITDGAGTEQFLEIFLAVSSTEAVNLTVDPSGVLLSKKDLESHNQDPDAHGGLDALAEALTLAEEAKSAADGAQQTADEALTAARENNTHLDAHNASPHAHEDLRAENRELHARLERLESILMSNITANPFLVHFTDLSAVHMDGVHNTTLNRIEF